MSEFLNDPSMEAAGMRIGEALREEAAFFRVVFRQSSVGMALLDIAGRVQKSNPALQRMLGYSDERLSSMHLGELTHIDERAHQLDSFRQMVQGSRDHYRVDIRFLRQGGTAIWCRFSADLVRDAIGQPASVICLVEDISEHTRSQRAIREMAAFAEYNPNPIFEFSPDGGLRYSNRAASELAHSMGKTDPSGILPPETREVVTQCWITGKSRLRLTTQLGARTISWSFFPIAAIGKVHCYAGDITEKLALENQLRQSQKLEAIGQLAAGVAHDFNNILTVIHGNASMFLVESNLPVSSMEYAQQVIQAAERGASLTRQLLVFSRKQTLAPANLDINEVVENMTRMLRRLLGENIALSPELGRDLPMIYADPGMIEQVLLNLAVNSRDAMPRGGKLRISTGVEVVESVSGREAIGARAGRFVYLSVEDTGCGIAPEHLTRIFEPFFTTKEAGKGTGLGLATVFGIIHQHQGWIEVESAEGKGTVFRIYLPSTDESYSEKPCESYQSSPCRGTETILIVEDEAPLRDMVSAILQRYGYSVFIADSGAAAMELWEQKKDKVDLVFTDMIMPGEWSGIELAKRFSTEKAGLKVLFTSGYSLETVSKGEFSEQQGTCFLQKPYHPSKLVQALRECLDGKHDEPGRSPAKKS